MSNSNIFIRAQFCGGTWVVIDPENNQKIPVDQMLMDAESFGDGYANGIVLSVHGLDQEIASRLMPRMLRSIGIGHPKRIGRTPRGSTRVRCTSESYWPQRT